MKYRIYVLLMLLVAASLLTACSVRNYEEEKPTEHGETESKA